jgi:FdhD protein
VSAAEKTKCYEALRYETGGSRTSSIELIGEEPFLIRIDDRSYCLVMRTPGEEEAHAAGFCLGEGIADSLDDFASVEYRKERDPNVIDIKLTPERREKIHDLQKRRGSITPTYCRMGGKDMIEELSHMVNQAENGFEIGIDRVFDCIGRLSLNQKYYLPTRGSHAALLCDDQLEKVAFGEDVGRHNAVDKAIGKAFLNRRLSRAKLLVLSSRISCEMVQKAARAHLSILISDARPTTLAVELGKALNMTLAFPTQESELVVVCGKHRIVRK